MEVETFSLILSFRYSHKISTRGAVSSASRTMIWDISWIDRSANERAEHLRCLFLGLLSCGSEQSKASYILFTILPDSVKILKTGAFFVLTVFMVRLERSVPEIKANLYKLSILNGHN